MNIFGKKVMLRAVEPSDAELLRDMVNDPDMEYMLGGWSFPVSVREQQLWMQSLSENTARNVLRVMVDAMDEIDSTENGRKTQTVGMAILSDIDYKNGNAQIHIKLTDGKCRRKGYGSDALTSLVQYAFYEIRLFCVYAMVGEHNVPSQKMLEKCGFKKEGVLRKRLYKHGQFINVLVYSIVQE